MKKSWIIIFLIFSFSLFLYRSIFSLDPDFGWHIRFGEIILHQGIPQTDPFSYTMPSYPFIDHEWLMSKFMAFMYPYIGRVGLAVFFSLFPLVALLITIQFFWKEPSRSLLLLSATILALFSGIRVQVLTWFFFSLLLLIINNPIYWKRFRFFLPVLFFVWVNIHGGFAIGIVALGISMVADLYEILKEERFSLNILISQYLNIFLLCLLATFLNPYGYRIWWEVWVSLIDSPLHWTISEWMPTLASPLEVSLWFFLFFSIGIFIIYRKKFSSKEIVFFLCFLIFGQASIRNFPLWVLIALPILFKSFDFFIDEAKKYRFGEQRAKILLKGFTIFVLIIVIIQTWLIIVYSNNLSESSFYPKNAVQFLHNHTLPGNIFSTYDWGGYLIWKLPEKKVFVDGRMPSWHWKAPSSKESNDAFLDYQNIGMNSLSLKRIVNKYHVSAFLLPVSIEEKTAKRPSWLSYLDNLFSKKKKAIGVDIPEELKRQGFKQIYEDKIAIVYQK